MGSPITFSGFNQIDFTVVLNAIMQQESRPLQALQTQQRTLQATDSSLAQLATKLDALRTAASALSGSSSSIVEYAATSGDATALTVSAGAGAVAGRYDVVVHDLARAQVTASESTVPDTDTTIVASGGTLTIGGVAVSITGPVTLRQLAESINATPDLAVTASLVQTSPGAFRLVLSADETGTSQAFTVQNALTSSTIAFTDTDDDGSSGDSAADNAVQASNASVSINNIAVTSESNVVSSGIPGVDINLLHADPAKTIAVTVARNDDSLVERTDAFVGAYNQLVKFANDQAAAADKGTVGTLARDALLRNLRNTLRSVLSGAAGTGDFTRLAEVGVGFSRTGELTLNKTTLKQAIQDNPSAVQQLFANSETGVFKAVDDTIGEYTRSGGLVPGARTRLSAELSRLGRRMDDMQARLAVRRDALQREFIAADQAMARLNSQSGSLASFAKNLNSSSL